MFQAASDLQVLPLLVRDFTENDPHAQAPSANLHLALCWNNFAIHSLEVEVVDIDISSGIDLYTGGLKS